MGVNDHGPGKAFENICSTATTICEKWKGPLIRDHTSEFC